MRTTTYSRCALIFALLGAAPALSIADSFPSSGKFSVTYTFSTSTPAMPIDVGGGRDLTVNNYLVTTINDADGGLLHHLAGHCTNIRFTRRSERTVDTSAYCNFKDADGDELFAEYATGGPVPIKAIVNRWKFVSGTGKYDGIQGTAVDNNTGNLDDQGAYQAAGKMVGSYRITRAAAASEEGTHD